MSVEWKPFPDKPGWWWLHQSGSPQPVMVERKWETLVAVFGSVFVNVEFIDGLWSMMEVPPV